MVLSQETIFSAFSEHPKPLVSYGLTFVEACQKHVETTFHASRIFIISSGSLAKNTDVLSTLQSTLNGRVAGTRIGMKPHTLFSEVVEVVRDCRKVNTDLIITLGGGSLIDAAKLIAFALANNVHTREDLIGLRNPPKDKVINQSSIPVISIPTSLSGGEFSNYAGATDELSHAKFVFGSTKGPVLVILDASLTKYTPISIWLSTGIRCVDHCVETLCSLVSDDEADDAAAKALVPLILGLMRTKRDGDDVEARHLCQLGVIGSMVHSVRGIPLGASHGIGRMLGPLGVGHGETSCILLPAVCKYNARHGANIDRQTVVLDILWGDEQLRNLFEKKGLDIGHSDLGDTLDIIIRELGMPRSLAEVNVERDKFDKLAENCVSNKCLLANPASITKKQEVLEILDVVAS